MSDETTNPPKLPPIITRRIADLETFKISDKDTNYFAMIADPIRDHVPFSIFLEIFEPGGKTPWHRHGHAHEMFLINVGKDKLYCLTLMLPNEDFAELVRRGFRVPLTADDMPRSKDAVAIRSDMPAFC